MAIRDSFGLAMSAPDGSGSLRAATLGESVRVAAEDDGSGNGWRRDVTAVKSGVARSIIPVVT